MKHLLLTTMLLMSCGQVPKDPTTTPQTVDPTATPVDASEIGVSFYIDAKTDLWACTDKLERQLVYVNEEDTFYYCKKTQWISVVLKGADGKDGVNGKDGINGTDGKDGIDGKAGAPGKDGTNGKDVTSKAVVVSAPQVLSGVEEVVAPAINIVLRIKYYKGTVSNGNIPTMPKYVQTLTLSEDDYMKILEKNLSCDLTTISENVYECSYLDSKVNCKNTYSTQPQYKTCVAPIITTEGEQF